MGMSTSLFRSVQTEDVLLMRYKYDIQLEKEVPRCLISQRSGRQGNTLSTYQIMFLSHSITYLYVKYRCLHLNKPANLNIITPNYCIKKV